VKRQTKPSGEAVRRVHAEVTATHVEAAMPIATVSEANMREHWAAKHRRKKMQQAVVRLWLGRALKRPPFPPPFLVTLVRGGTRKLDPGNLEGCFKHVQDEVARLIGVDDGDDAKVSWEYMQIPGCKGRAIGVYVRVEPRPKDYGNNGSEFHAAVKRALAGENE
jgi:hypothetical protein